MIFDVIVYGVGYSQDVIFGGDPRPTALAVLHAAPERAAAPHAVRHKDVWLIYQLEMTTFRLYEVQVPFHAAVDVF